MIQITKLTDKGIIEMYMKEPKEKLAEMLLQCNKIIDNTKRENIKEKCPNCGESELFGKDNYCNCCGAKKDH